MDKLTNTRMKHLLLSTVLLPALMSNNLQAQNKDSLMVAAIVQEATGNSQLQPLGQELMDGIGPRLVGSPKMQQAPIVLDSVGDAVVVRLPSQHYF
jgi:carboxypeptidase Q